MAQGWCTPRPRIYLIVFTHVEMEAISKPNPTTFLLQLPRVNKNQVDESCIIFWEVECHTILDMSLTAADTKTHRTTEVSKVVARHEMEIIFKYLHNCLEMQKDILPWCTWLLELLAVRL